MRAHAIYILAGRGSSSTSTPSISCRQKGGKEGGKEGEQRKPKKQKRKKSEQEGKKVFQPKKVRTVSSHGLALSANRRKK